MFVRIVAVCVCVLCYSPSVYAHPPERIDAEFDEATKVLAVTVVHHVMDHVRHYIKAVTIERNHEECIHHTLVAQDDSEELKLQYRLPSINSEETTLNIKAECSIEGTLSTEIVINKQPEEFESGGE